MDIYLARQPILDKKLQVYGYKLLFRGGVHASAYDAHDTDYATANTAMENFQAIGLESITCRKPAFINFTAPLLTAGTAALIPKDLIVIELSESIRPSAEINEACRKLQKKGYTLALDYFVDKPEYAPLVQLSKIIKINFFNNSPQQVHQMIDDAELRDKRLVAENIDSYEMFNVAAGMGFTLFQGYFFTKPLILFSKRLTPFRISYVNMLNEINNNEEADYSKLEEIIRGDIALCHKLLRMVNSVYYSLKHKVASIKQALVVLGVYEIRKWIYFLSIMELGTDKPDELIRMSLIRGFFTEQLFELRGKKYPKDTLFFLGIFSMIDILIGQPMKTALSDLNLMPEVIDALAESRGDLYDYLQIIVSIETGNWSETDRLAIKFGINVEFITDNYLRAIKMCDDILIKEPA